MLSRIAINFVLKLIKNLKPGISWHHLVKQMLERAGYQLTHSADVSEISVLVDEEGFC